MGNFFVGPIRVEVGLVRQEFGIWSLSIRWKYSISCDKQGSGLYLQHSLCCDSAFILFASNLQTQLAGNKASPGHVSLRLHFHFTRGQLKNSTTQQGWKYHQQNQINMLHSLLNSD